MTQRTPTSATIGLTVLALFLLALPACSDKSEEEPPQTSHSSSTEPRKEAAKDEVDPAYLPKTTAIRDGEFWRVHVTLPKSLPEGATVKAITCKTDDESHELEYDPNIGPVTFLIGNNMTDYEVIITDNKKRTYSTKGSVK